MTLTVTQTITWAECQTDNLNYDSEIASNNDM